MKQKGQFEITSMGLHILAMFLMLCDHLWATVVPGNDWLTCIGRIAFPVFAFMIVEGYFRTRNLKEYVRRLFTCALLSEVPFNLVMGSDTFYPFHQNVLWTFLIGILLIYLNERAKKRGKLWFRILVGAGTIFLGFILGLLTMVDYHYAGVYTILVFYFFRGGRWHHFLGQLISLTYINLEILGGLAYEINIFGNTYYLAQQGFALLALIPIWLYRGKQGHYNKGLRYLYYAFYPVHLLILGIICSGTQWEIITDIILIVINFLVVVTVVDIILIGLPILKVAGKAEKESFFVEKENHSEIQGKVECSGFSSAYVYRHFGKAAKGMEVYKEMPCKSSNGYVYCKGIVKLARNYGFFARLRTGNMHALRNTVAKGIPVIVMIRTRPGSSDLHYVPVVGYDKDFFYIVDSAKSFRNAVDVRYNRKIPVKEFKKLWNISTIWQPLYFNLFFEISKEPISLFDFTK